MKHAFQRKATGFILTPFGFFLKMPGSMIEKDWGFEYISRLEVIQKIAYETDFHLPTDN